MINLEQTEIKRVSSKPKVFLPSPNGFKEKSEGLSCVEQIEPLRPNQTLQILCDIDHTLIGLPSEETPALVKNKITLLNKNLLEWSHQTNKQIIFSLLTQKPELVFSDKETQPIYGPLLNISSVRKGKTSKQEDCLITIPVSHAYCELGAVTRITDPFTGEVQTKIDAAYQPTQKLVQDLSGILQEHFCTQNESSTAKFRLEPGNIAYTSLQMSNGSPMSEEIKKQTKTKLIDLLTILNRTDILATIDFITEHNDLDCFPHLLTQRGKAIGVHSDVFSKHEQGYPWMGLKEIVIIDDKYHAAGKASEEILSQDGSAITLSNGDQALKDTISSHPNGYVSPHSTFLGVIDGLNHFFTGKSLTQVEINNINQQLFS